MRTPFVYCVCLAMLMLGFSTNAGAPPTDDLINYHDSGQYYQDICTTIRDATYYMQFRLTQNERSRTKRKLAIVMDIDETALSNYEQLQRAHFQITPKMLEEIQRQSKGTAIPYTLALYNYAKDHGVDIFFITGRHHSTTAHTLDNLAREGYRAWKQITFNPAHLSESTKAYRVLERRKIQMAGYDIIMNIGNRSITLAGGAADMTFQLPNPYYHFG